MRSALMASVLAALCCLTLAAEEPDLPIPGSPETPRDLLLDPWLGRDATVGGGYACEASHSFATVGGGYGDSACACYATVGGGQHNIAKSWRATVGGGHDNTAYGAWATVGGGYSNIASGKAAAVSGGYDNLASGEYAAVSGGYRNKAFGYASFAAGSRAETHHSGSFVWSDSCGSDSLITTCANQFLVRARGGVRFYTDCTNYVYLSPSSNAWASGCDSARKEDFRPVDRRALLEKLASLRVRDYKIKEQHDGTRHLGPTAQDFHAAFGYGESNRGINMADADGVLLAAVQALYEDNRALRAELEALKADLTRE